MDFRTDLAIERFSVCNTDDCDGIEKKVRRCGDCTVTQVTVTNKNGSMLLGKPEGRYITVEIPSFACDSEMLDGRLDALIDQLASLIPKRGTVLIAGLGNRDMTADALGPLCADRIFATRHISKELASSLGFDRLRSVASLSPGVLGKTGMEASEVIQSVVEKIKPCCVITVDALAALDINRLGTTVQITDTGISPGSGVGNSRKEINSNTLGVPVIAIGVPTVISAYTLAQNVLDEADSNADISNGKKFSEFIVASGEADLISERASKFIALAVNSALQQDISIEDLMALM